MKKFLFMLPFAGMAFTLVFAQERQHPDQNTRIADKSRTMTADMQPGITDTKDIIIR